MTNNTKIDIETAAGYLLNEARRNGNHALARACKMVVDGEMRLHDSATAREVSPEDLGIDALTYVELVRESCDSRQAEGHVRTPSGRRVFARN